MKKLYKVKVNGKAYEVELEEVKEVAGSVESTLAPTQTPVNPAPASGNSTNITAPMPGSVFDLKVSVGDSVSKGQVVAILEAMKMETEILSDTDGTVTAIVSEKGKQVQLGDTILTIN